MLRFPLKGNAEFVIIEVSEWKKFWLRWAIRLIRKNFEVCEISTNTGVLRGIFITKDLLDSIE